MSLVQIMPSVRAAIAEMLAAADTAKASGALSAAYRGQPGHAVLLNEAGKRAYLAARLPATYAAILRTLNHVAAAGATDFDSVLDAGCGPGTGSLAAGALWPGLRRVTRSDLDGTWRKAAETLGAASGVDALAQGRWLTGGMDTLAFPQHDAVIAAYALNEVPAAQRRAAIRNLWSAAAQALILIEPGTPQGFLNIRDARDELLALGAFTAAPCTHRSDCPMSEADWCHTTVRLERDALHRSAKDAALPYEDEKFSYLAVTRTDLAPRSTERIVRRPVAHSGHLTLDVCGPDGLTRRTISRRDGALYKAARKIEWGDGWPPA